MTRLTFRVAAALPASLTLLASLVSPASTAQAAPDHGSAMEHLWPTTLPAAAGEPTPIAAFRVRESYDAPWSEVLALSLPGGGLEWAIRVESPSFRPEGEYALRIRATGPDAGEVSEFDTTSEDALDEGLLFSAAEHELSPQTVIAIQGGRARTNGSAKSLAKAGGEDLSELCPDGDCTKWLKSELEKWVKRLEKRPLADEAALMQSIINGGVFLDLTGAHIPLTMPGCHFKLVTDSSGVTRLYMNPGWPYSVATMKRMLPLVIAVHALMTLNPSLDMTDAVFIALGLEMVGNEKQRLYLANFFQILVLIAQHSNSTLMANMYGYWVAALNYADGSEAAVAAAMAALRAAIEAAGQELKALPSTELQDKASAFGQDVARFFDLLHDRDWETMKSEFGLTDAQIEIAKKM